MPIIVPKDIPASKILKSENIFVMNEARAQMQDIRPLEIAILKASERFATVNLHLSDIRKHTRPTVKIPRQCLNLEYVN